MRDGYEHLPDDPQDDEDDGPAWSPPWPPLQAPAPQVQQGTTPGGRSLDAVRPRHVIKFYDLHGLRISYGLWNGTVSLAFPWICESEAEALAARTELDPKDWGHTASRCQHGRQPALAYREFPKPIHWATTYCPECAFHDERNPTDSLGVRGYVVFQWGPPPCTWDKPIDY